MNYDNLIEEFNYYNDELTQEEINRRTIAKRIALVAEAANLEYQLPDVEALLLQIAILVLSQDAIQDVLPVIVSRTKIVLLIAIARSVEAKSETIDALYNFINDNFPDNMKEQILQAVKSEIPGIFS